MGASRSRQTPEAVPLGARPGSPQPAGYRTPQNKHGWRRDPGDRPRTPPMSRQRPLCWCWLEVSAPQPARSGHTQFAPRWALERVPSTSVCLRNAGNSRAKHKGSSQAVPKAGQSGCGRHRRHGWAGRATQAGRTSPAWPGWGAAKWTPNALGFPSEKVTGSHTTYITERWLTPPPGNPEPQGGQAWPGEAEHQRRPARGARCPAAALPQLSSSAAVSSEARHRPRAAHVPEEPLGRQVPSGGGVLHLHPDLTAGYRRDRTH